MTQINVYIKNPVVMSNVTCLLIDFGKVLCSSANELQQTQTLLLEKSLFHKYWLFCARFFMFTFDLCGLLSVIRKQELKQCNYSVDQSALLTGFRTDFTSSVWNFCHWVADIPLREMPPVVKSVEKRMFSQATTLPARRGIRKTRGLSSCSGNLPQHGWAVTTCNLEAMSSIVLP